MAVKQLKHYLVAIKSETSYGVDAWAGSAPAAGDWVSAYDADATEKMTEVQDMSVRPFASQLAHRVYGSHVDVTLSIPARGKSGVAGTPAPAPIDAAIKAAGNKATVVSATSVTYTPQTFHTQALCPSVSIYIAYFYTDGTVRVQRVLGVKFNEMKITAAAKAPLMLSFTGRGLYGELSAAAGVAPTNPASYSGGKPLVLSQGGTLAIGTETGIGFSAFEIVSAWDMNAEEDLTTLNESKNFDLTRGARPAGSCTFSGSAHLLYFLTNRRSAAALALAAVFTNGTDAITITAPSVQLGEVGKGKGNVWTFPAPFYCSTAAEAGNDDYAIKFT